MSATVSDSTSPLASIVMRDVPGHPSDKAEEDPPSLLPHKSGQPRAFATGRRPQLLTHKTERSSYQPRIHWPTFWREAFITALPPLVAPAVSYWYDGKAGWRNRHFWGLHYVTVGQIVMGVLLYWNIISVCMMPWKEAREVLPDVAVTVCFILTRVIMVAAKWSLRPVQELRTMSRIAVPEKQLRAVELSYGWNSLFPSVVKKECERTASNLGLTRNSWMHLRAETDDAATLKRLVAQHFDYACRTVDVEPPQLRADGSIFVSVRTWVCATVLASAPRRLSQSKQRRRVIVREAVKVTAAMLLSVLPTMYRSANAVPLTAGQWRVQLLTIMTTFMISYNFVFTLMLGALDDYRYRESWLQAASCLLETPRGDKLSIDLEFHPRDLQYFLTARKWVLHFGIQYQRRVQWWFSTLFILCVGLALQAVLLPNGSSGALVLMVAFVLYVMVVFLSVALSIGYRVNDSVRTMTAVLSALKMRAHHQFALHTRHLRDAWLAADSVQTQLASHISLVDDVIQALEVELRDRPMTIVGVPIGAGALRAVLSILGSGVVAVTRTLVLGS
eukprot:PLAT10563.1.p1 GENE.PLAT10563.1~~PLAT10563.1.p1  ORF type:complete len:560 (-),score=165.47 PLAT10563.1:58-1737(-)